MNRCVQCKAINTNKRLPCWCCGHSPLPSDNNGSRRVTQKRMPAWAGESKLDSLLAGIPRPPRRPERNLE